MRQHGCGLRFGVVQQDNSLSGPVEPIDQHLQFLLRRHGFPITRPQIGTEHGDAARLQQLKRGRCGFETGKPEEWRGRCAARDTVERHLNRGNTVVDFLCCLVWRDPHQAAVQPGMMPDGVALGRDPSHQAWMLGSRLADQEERRAHAFMGQRRQHPLRGRRPRAVIECQYHLVIPERQRLRKALKPNPRGGGGIDAKNPRGTERSLAWTVRRLRRHRPCDQGNKGSSRPLHELPGADFDFSALNEVDDSVRDEILEELEPETVAEGVRELESDDAVKLLAGLDEEDQEEILEKLPPLERDALERSLLYPENSAGRRMQTEFIAVPPDWTVGQAIDYMRDTPELPDRFYEIYAVDSAQHWQGAISLDALLRAHRPVPLADLIDEDRRRVSVMDDQGEVARLFGKYNLVAAPVVDTTNRLVGVITIDDVVDVIEEEADEDLKALGGVTSDEELSDNVWTIAKGRFNWLLVNLATAFLASSVLGLFEGQLEKMVALAVLAPIVASQGGNAATQTMTVAVRALATRELGSNNAFRVVMREGLVGLVNGLAFAVITGIAAVAWFKIPALGVVIGLVMVCNLVAGALGGILIPMVLERVRADPAVASGTFVTTITDVVGFFSFLGIATLWFGLK